MIFVALATVAIPRPVCDVPNILHRLGSRVYSSWAPEAELIEARRFGAVLEEFEVRDALHNVFATRYGGFTFE